MATSLRFAITFLAMFILMYLFMGAVDALPEPLPSNEGVVTVSPSVEAPLPPATGMLPTRVVASSIGMDNQVLNPGTTDIAALDEALLKGVVRYPTSGELGVNGTVLLFGHSSYLPVVRNQNYKAFNGIQKLKVGDTITVYAGDIAYTYAVTNVREANATADSIPLLSDAQYLTLVTCDTFGQKSDRFVVTAKRI